MVKIIHQLPTENPSVSLRRPPPLLGEARRGYGEASGGRKSNANVIIHVGNIPQKFFDRSGKLLRFFIFCGRNRLSYQRV